MEELGSHWTDFGGILHLSFFENQSIKCKFHYNPTRITGTVHEDVFTFITISRRVLLRMRNIPNKSCRENQNTHFMFSNFLPENRTVCGRMSKNVVEPERVQMAIWRGRCVLD